MGLALAFANILMNGIIMNHIGAFGGTLIGFNMIQASTLSKHQLYRLAMQIQWDIV